MLNISNNNIRGLIERDNFTSFRRLKRGKAGKVLNRLLGFFSLLFLVFIFLPWTQNIRSYGSVTTLKPEQRPQTIHSVIGGRIEEWFVQEGDFVEKGDTILFISEVKDEYFDPNLLARTQAQVDAKEMSVESYSEKIKALDNQVSALLQASQLKLQQVQNKLQQARFKVNSDSIDYQAKLINYQVAQERLLRMENLYKDGLKSLTDLESRQMSLQKAQAEKISGENKLLGSRNELINARVEITSIQAKYREEIAKAQSSKFSALSDMYDAEATVTKLKNSFMNYSVRTGMYYITAPQSGYITKAIQSGIGETLKAGDPLISIMPARYDLAVETYVRPLDLPLLAKGQHVRIRFDGWPAIVFSGWPNTSYGTYGGQVYAMDNFISENGMYRILVAPDPNDHPWPEALRVGAGTTNMLLLKDVPLWYELWRQLNGFPPDYYTGPDVNKTTKPKKSGKK